MNMEPCTRQYYDSHAYVHRLVYAKDCFKCLALYIFKYLHTSTAIFMTEQHQYVIRMNYSHYFSGHMIMWFYSPCHTQMQIHFSTNRNTHACVRVRTHHKCARMRMHKLAQTNVIAKWGSDILFPNFSQVTYRPISQNTQAKIHKYVTRNTYSSI